MKIKVGDLTIKEKHNLCKKSICSRCPLYVYNQNPILSCHDMCAASYTSGYDIVVDFPEDCVDWDVRLPEGIKEVVLNSMDIRKEKESEEEKWPIHSKNDALQMIVDLADDYDNANSVEGLKNLIDELVEVAKAGMTKQVARTGLKNLWL